MQFSDLVNPIFIAKVIDFVIFVAAIVFVYQRFLKRALVAYQDEQNKAFDDATQHLAETKDSVDSASAAIEQAKAAAARMIDVGRAQAERLLTEESAAATEHAQRLLAHAQGEQERERYRVRREMLEDTVERATAAARELVKRELTPAKQDELVHEAVSAIGTRHA
jgi:F0F1-type ATP synthase membrane subunit b/b'